MQKTEVTRLEQLNHLKQAKNAQKQEEEVKQPKHFKQAKGLRHLKQGRGKVSKIHHASLYQIPNKDLYISTIQNSHFEAFQLCHISTYQHLEDKLSRANIFIAQ